MAAMMSYVEIAVEDSERALRFYGNVFNWAYFRAPAETPYYVMGELDGMSLAGIFPAAFAPQTLTFFPTQDFDATLTRIRRHGGRVIEAHPEEGLGRVAQWKDPHGNKFGLTELASDAPVATVTRDKALWRPRNATRAHGTPAYVEIGVEEAKNAVNFYGNVFGWASIAAKDGQMQYHFAGEVGKTAFAVIRPIAFAPRTIPYFRTDDLDATTRRVQRYGGRVFHTGRRHAGAGPIAQCKDPDGNAFGLVQFTRNAPAARLRAAA